MTADRRTTAHAMPRASLPAMACAALLAMAVNPAAACGSNAARAALQAPQIASKFALASSACAEESERLAGPGPRTDAAATPALVEVRAQAEQLALYDPRPAPVAPMAPEPVIAPSIGALAPRAHVPSPQAPLHSSLPVRPLKGVGRESVARALALVPEINRVAEAYQIDPLLLHAIAHVESRHNPDAVSHAGALGLMQVMPATARRFGVTQPNSQLRNPAVSLEVSSAYLKTLQKRFDNNLTLVIAAYNAGEGAVEKYGRRVPPYKETQGYVRDVMSHYLLLISVRDAGTRAARATL